MDIQTHPAIDKALCGTPTELKPGFCKVSLTPGDRMKADESGLIHGGFVFGLADYAAMLAVNHPHVVLAAVECQFLKPVRAGESLSAEARIVESSGKWRTVDVQVLRGETKVFKGRFSCAVPDRHVLDTTARG